MQGGVHGMQGALDCLLGHGGQYLLFAQRYCLSTDSLHSSAQLLGLRRMLMCQLKQAGLGSVVWGACEGGREQQR